MPTSLDPNYIRNFYPPHFNQPQMSPSEFSSQAASVRDPSVWRQLKAQWQTNPLRYNNPTEWRRLQDQVLYGNPVASMADTETSKGRPGLWGRLVHGTERVGQDVRRGWFSYGARRDLWPMLLGALGTAYATGAIGAGAAGAGAGAGAGAEAGAGAAGAGTASTVGPMSASTVDPFLAGGGTGAWESIGGTALFPTLSGAAALPESAAMASAPAAASSSTSWMSTPWGKALLKGGIGMATQGILNRPTSAENRLSNAANAGYSSADVQKFLPLILQDPNIGPLLQSGIAGIGDLLANPGGLSPTVEDAIRARLAAESQNIATNYRGIASNQAGAAARGNLPVSIKGALQSALDIAQARDQRAARQTALTESDTLRRQDLAQTYNLLNQIQQFIASGRGQSLQALAMSAADARNRQAATLAFIGDILTSMATSH